MLEIFRRGVDTYTQMQSSNFNLNTGIGQFWGFGANGSNAIEDARSNILPRQCTLRRLTIFIGFGNHDAIITFTVRETGVSTAKLITIPASAGVANYNDDTDEVLIENSRLAYLVGGGGGAGNTTMNGFSQEFVK